MIAAASGLFLAVALGATPAVAGCDPTALREGLEARARADAAARQDYVETGGSKPAEDLVLRLDAEHRAWLRPVLERCGWPTEALVGAAAARGAWLIAQHADMDPEFQAFAAARLEAAVLAGEASGRSLALLVDRSRRMQRRPQVYGMQFRTEEGVARYLPVEDPAALDARRTAIGLEPFACAHAALLAAHPTLAWPDGVPRSECPASP